MINRIKFARKVGNNNCVYVWCNRAVALYFPATFLFRLGLFDIFDYGYFLTIETQKQSTPLPKFKKY